MEFAFNDEQRLIQETAARFLAEVSDSAAVRAAMVSAPGYEPAVWARIAEEMYWPALHIPEQYGGLGLGLVELSILLEQMGRYLLCAPFYATACLATPALLLSDNQALKEQWLPAIAAGTSTATLAFAGNNSWDADSVQAVVQPCANGYRLNGEYLQVVDGAQADLLIVAVRSPGTSGEAGISLFALPASTPGVARHTLPTLDQTRRLARIELHNVELSAADLLGAFGASGPLLREVLQIACIGLAAEQVGGAQQALDLTLAYTRERQQFGRAIASFQAVKHRCADLMLELECARSAAYYAACVAQERLDPHGDAAVRSELAVAAATAKIHASEAFFHGAADAIQLHGGVGFTWEYDPHLYFKRARASEQFLGTPAVHRERLAVQILGEQL
ncbi:acyl-CoA/acyl-ACP dehydrogenase [Pseudomonas sp. LS44]|uniref:acyl-CoA dehydrogenase family protein n=1 Tax=Pseudomonas sp. LS44 TaxID=1357074 RepID=UPI00215A1F6A|nr:acyl-CoA dehydrogenase family protein [Pseudomonas sp. LS44]UVE17435.1 acyl-CoA/acyl-ACP dehydrogenase [Pseudomonas sp. LS44]